MLTTALKHAGLLIMTVMAVSCVSSSGSSVPGADVGSSVPSGGGGGSQTTQSTIGPAAEFGRGIPFGPTKLPPEAMDGVFTGTKLSPWPGSILEELEEARSHGLSVILVMVGSQSNYTDPDGSFNFENWKAEMEAYRDIDFSEFIEDGTIIAHQLIDEAKARNQWDGTVIHNDTIDEMARLSKEIWPSMITAVRAEPTDLRLHGAAYETPLADYEWQHLDTAWAPYSHRKGPVSDYISSQQQEAERQGLGLILELNAYNGGDGSSDIPSPDPLREERWAMSAEELVDYGTILMKEARACALVIWRYETLGSGYGDFVYFRRPDVEAAMSQLSEVAAAVPSYPCVVDR